MAETLRPGEFRPLEGLLATVRDSETYPLPTSGLVRFVTKSGSTYEYRPATGEIKGGRHIPEWTPGRVAGSTFGGSAIMLGRLVIGLHAEISGAAFGTLTTTPVMHVEIEPAA